MPQIWSNAKEIRLRYASKIIIKYRWSSSEIQMNWRLKFFNQGIHRTTGDVEIESTFTVAGGKGLAIRKIRIEWIPAFLKHESNKPGRPYTSAAMALYPPFRQQKVGRTGCLHVIQPSGSYPLKKRTPMFWKEDGSPSSWKYLSTSSILNGRRNYLIIDICKKLNLLFYSIHSQSVECQHRWSLQARCADAAERGQIIDYHSCSHYSNRSPRLVWQRCKNVVKPLNRPQEPIALLNGRQILSIAPEGRYVRREQWLREDHAANYTKATRTYCSFSFDRFLLDTSINVSHTFVRVRKRSASSGEHGSG